MKRIVITKDAPQPVGPYSQAVISNGLVFVSGQLPIDPVTGNIVSESVTGQTTQVMKNLQAVLEAAGSGLDRVLKATVYVKDLSQFGAMNEVFARFFTQNPPARATIEAARLPRDVLVEIDVIAEVG
jgi:2-iminobutanoate/2-iminopropanoate deaminase